MRSSAPRRVTGPRLFMALVAVAALIALYVVTFSDGSAASSATAASAAPRGDDSDLRRRLELLQRQLSSLATSARTEAEQNKQVLNQLRGELAALRRDKAAAPQPVAPAATAKPPPPPPPPTSPPVPRPAVNFMGLPEANIDIDWPSFNGESRKFEQVAELRHRRRALFGELTSATPFLMTNFEGVQIPPADEHGQPLSEDAYPQSFKDAAKKAFANVDVEKEYVVALMTGQWFGPEYMHPKPCRLPDGRTLKCKWVESGGYPTEKADALWYHIPGGSPQMFTQSTANPRQRVCVMGLESESIYSQLQQLRKQIWQTQTDHADKSMVPLTMGYRLDADVPHLYADVFHWNHTRPTKPFGERLQKAVYMQSHCVGYRDTYVQQLMKDYPVDAGGACLHNVNLPGRHDSGRNADIYQNYRYVMTFENSIVDFYVTERVYQALLGGAIPIYMGAPHPDLSVPRDSVIFAADYPDPRDLAKYLHRIDNEPELQRKHSGWQKGDIGGEVFRRIMNLAQKVDYGPQCRLCIKLAHRCGPECPCGGKLFDRHKYEDGRRWT